MQNSKTASTRAQPLCLILLFISVAFAQTCTKQGVFPSNIQSPLLCDGDAGGSEIKVTETSVSHEVVFGGADIVFDGDRTPLPTVLELVIKRKGNGAIRRGKSFILADGRKIKAPSRPTPASEFVLYYNVLQILVRGFETGDCPIDNKGQVFPELASVRGGLLSLSSVFLVEDCSESISVGRTNDGDLR